MPLVDVLLHTATPIRMVDPGEWVEGERLLDVERGASFPCVLFLPDGNASNRRGRQVLQPQVMWEPLYPSGSILEGQPVSLRNGDRLAIVNPEVNRASGVPENTESLWVLSGDPQPLNKPGVDLIGFYAVVKGVKD